VLLTLCPLISQLQHPARGSTHMLVTRPAVQATPRQVLPQWQALLHVLSALPFGSRAFLICSSAARSARVAVEPQMMSSEL
jgi:hypothetical protein